MSSSPPRAATSPPTPTIVPDEEQDLGERFAEQAQVLVEHLDELRMRLIVSLSCVALGTVIGWIVAPRVIDAFAQRVDRLIYVAVTEAFFARFKIALAVGVLLALPVIVHQAWRFVLPALFPDEERIIRPMVWTGLLLLAMGFAFGYWVVYPLSLSFFLQFGTEGLRPAISINRHLAFFLGTTLSFGMAFQMPLVILTLVRMGVITAVWLRQMRRQALFFAFVVGALLTPADAVSQVLMAIPLFVLYEIAVVCAPRFEPKGASTQGE